MQIRIMSSTETILEVRKDGNPGTPFILGTRESRHIYAMGQGLKGLFVAALKQTSPAGRPPPESCLLGDLKLVPLQHVRNHVL